MTTLPFRTIFIGLLLLGFSQMGFGQVEGAAQGVGVIKGILVDSLTGQPLEYVAVALRRGNFTKVVNGAITDEKGAFRLEAIPTGSYKLTFTFVGYENKTLLKVDISATNSEFNCKKILLKSATSTLKEVEITAQKQLIEQRVDRIVYNVEKDASASTQTLNDILRKVPMVTVDAEGKPSLRGNSNIQVLINGKPSGIFAANVADALRTIPADQVLRVEVLTSVSAKYDAEGTAGIINIITKKKQVEGYNGSANLSSGLLLGNGSFNINTRLPKIGFNATVSGNSLFPRKVENSFFRMDNLGDSQRQTTQEGNTILNRHSASAQIGLDYDLNSQNGFTSTFRLTQSDLVGNGGLSTQNILTTPQTESVTRWFRDMGNKRTDANFDWTTDYKRTFKNPKNELSASVQWSKFTTNGLYSVDETLVPTKEYSLKEKGVNQGNNNEVTAQVDYTKDLGKIGTLETGLKNIYRDISSTSDYMEYKDSYADYVKSDARSNTFNYLQNVSAAYVTANIQTKTKWGFQVGSRLENTFIRNNTQNGQGTDNNYLNLTPSVLATYTFKNSANLRISYNRRIQRPGLEQLNPFINSSDPRNLMQGNIDLKPEIANKFESSYSYYHKKGFFYLAASYDLTDGLIERVVSVRPDGVAIHAFQNIGVTNIYGGQVFTSYQMNSIWTLRGGGNIYRYVAKGSAVLGGLSNKGIQGSLYGISSLAFKKGFTIDAIFQYQAPTYTAQGRNQDLLFVIFNASAEVLKKKGSITLTAINPFWKNLNFVQTSRGLNFEQTRGMTMPIRTVNLGFSYKFGKAGSLKKERKSVKNSDLKEAEKQNF